MQLSPIQCTYSNIFIRFFKFFPANANIYQNSYRVPGALCGLRQGVLSLRAEKRGPRGILCTRGEKEYASIRQAIVACGNRLVKNEAYDAFRATHFMSF